VFAAKHVLDLLGPESLDLSASIDQRNFFDASDCDGDSEAADIITRARARFRPLPASLDPRFEPPPSETPIIDQRAESASTEASTGAHDLGAAPGVVGVLLPQVANADVEIFDDQSSLALKLRLLDTSEVASRTFDSFSVFPNAHVSGADIIQRANRVGVEDFLVFETPPAEPTVRYAIELSQDVAGMRLVANSLELLDEQGTPRLRMSPPSLTQIDGTNVPATVNVQGCSVDTNARPPWRRSVTSPGAQSCIVEITWDPSTSYPAMLDPAWSSTSNNLSTARYDFVAVAMPAIGAQGSVLVSGGYTLSNVTTSTSEQYDTATHTWSSINSMPGALAEHAGVLLSNGNVMVAGGTATYGSSATNKVYLYTPAA
jgi:hypothetical protein